MELWTVHIARLPRVRDDVSSPHGGAALHQQGPVVGIGGHPAPIVLEQQQVAEAAKLVAGVDNDPVLGGANRRALRHGDVHAIVGAGPCLQDQIR